ncbi:MAG TPA: hypothetical protein VE130_14750 [Nitrososphaeraceae archaeon]|nr:hypothetical protein [Nitrososphaeraceae archaeon]
MVVLTLLSLLLTVSLFYLYEQNTKAKEAVEYITTTATTANNSTTTFTAKGLISSLLPQFGSLQAQNNSNIMISYILGGYWNLDVVQGLVNDFKVNFTMVRPDGTGLHWIEFINFKQNKLVPVVLDLSEGTTFAGTMDIKEGNEIRWIGSPVSITISHLNVLSITPNSEYTNNFFQSQPIYGVVNNVTLSNNNDNKTTFLVSPIL